jgi:SAM-dependent methyltransferase
MSKLTESPHTRRNRKPQLGWFHRYPARFSTTVLAEMMKGIRSRLRRKPRLLLDPFAGTASSLAFARQLGIASTGIELSMLGVLIGKARLSPPSDLEAALDAAKKLVELPQRKKHRFTDELIGWIGEKNACALDAYLTTINELSDPKLRRWLRVSVSSALRPCSRWLSGSIKPQVDPLRDPTPIGPHLLRAANALRRDCRLEAFTARDCPRATIEIGDARNLPFANGEVDAILTSPPYETMYDYFDVHRLSYLAFEWPQPLHRQIGQPSGVSRDGVGFDPPPFMTHWYRRHLRAENSCQGRALRAYVVAMRQHVAEVKRVLSHDGVAAYAVANTIRDGRKFSLVPMVASLFRDAGFRRVEIRTRKSSHRRILPAGRNRVTGRFSSDSTEHVVNEYIVYARH